MGCCLSLANATREPLQSANNISNAIYREMPQSVKILILGTMRSGKSTIYKQLSTICGETSMGEKVETLQRRQDIQYIHEQCIGQMKLALERLLDFTDDTVLGHEELMRNWKEYICSPHDDLMNLVFGYIREFEEECCNDVFPLTVPRDIRLQVFQQCMWSWTPYIPDLSEQGMEAADIIQSLHHTKLRLTDEVVDALKILWDEPAIQKMYEMRNITGLSDSTAHFWNNLEVISDQDYIPDSADMLLVRKRTTGVSECQYQMDNSTLRIVEVGGAKSERKKWIHCFDSVSTVLFVASLTCYDHVLMENSSINAMTDQLELFGAVINDEYLMTAPIVLLLNKKDLFTAKIKRVPLTVCQSFYSYSGKRDSYEETTKYIRDEFISLNKIPHKRQIFAHLTCALDTDNIQKVFADVQDILVLGSIVSAGLME